MAVNSICWKMPSRFRFYSAKSKRKVRVQPYLIEFNRLLESSITAIEGVSNEDLLHAVVALYDICLPEITPEVLYPTVCGKWEKTIVLLRDFQDLLLEMKGVSPESDEDPELTEDSLKPFISSKLWRDIFDEQSTETKSEDLPADKQETGNNNKETKNLSKQVSWNDDAQDVKNESTDSAHENSQEDDESTDDLNTVYDECSTKRNTCKCDSKETKTHQYKETEKNDLAEERNGNKNETMERDVEPGKFDGVFSDTDDSDATAESEDEEEDFSKGVEDFVEAAKKRRLERQNGNVSESNLGIESLIIGAATFERSYSTTRHKPSEKVMQLNLLGIRKRCRKSGIGKFLLETLKDPIIIGPYDTIAVYADNDAVDFFKKNGFTDDVVLCSRFTDLTDNWINSTLMCYLPPFTGTDYSGAFRSEEDLKAMDDDIRKWREKSLEAYQAQATCVVRMQHEIKTLRAVVDTQDEAIKTLTSAKERLVKEKHKLEKELLAYKMKDKDGILDSKDCDSEDEELVSSFIASRSEKQLVQQMKRSLMATKNYKYVTINSVKRVESCHIAFMETGFDARTQRLGDPVVCTQLYYCGGSDDKQIERIMKQGFSKEDFTRGPYGKGLYFSMQASQAAAFSSPGKLLLCNVGLGLTESVVVRDRGRTLPPPGFDSILTGGRPPSPVFPGHPQQEYVVFDPLQAIPVYLVEYSTSR
ncbi:uncharacterized protein LOC111323938 isoform X2 [Stylophora pistillata]|uniref:uncharacterized protein LOC111323938 isoform X2 n=1 Tax=Stylophora pistillata TaxID=50429 RepID=UPI000C04B81A|nr:uncharacterized protein LOC111323938 isoform X2 [Stylophora pistillata]